MKDKLTSDEFWFCTLSLYGEEREVLRRFKDRVVDFTGGNFKKFLRKSRSVYLNEDYCKTSLQDNRSKLPMKSSADRTGLLVEACVLIMGEDKSLDVNRANKYGNVPFPLISALRLP